MIHVIKFITSCVCMFSQLAQLRDSIGRAEILGGQTKNQPNQEDGG